MEIHLKRKMQTRQAEDANHPERKMQTTQAEDASHPKRKMQTTQAGDANHPSGRCKPSQTKIRFHVSWKIWIPYSNFQDFLERIFIFLRPPYFPKSRKPQVPISWKFPKPTLDKDSGFSLNCLRYPGVTKNKNNWFWESWSCPEIPKS